MLNKKVQDAINEQIKDGSYFAYLYLSMAAYSEDANLPGIRQSDAVAGPGRNDARDEIL